MKPHMRSRISRGTVAVLVSLSALACSDDPDDIPSAPHPMIVIDISGLRPDRLGLYEPGRDTSPHLDALSKSSFVFDWAFGQAPVVTAALASIHTGRYPSSHGLVQVGGSLADDVPTLAEVLQKSGIETAAFVDGGYLAPGFGFDRGFDLYDDSGAKGLSEVVPKAIDWLESRRDRSFFLFVQGSDLYPPFGPSPTPPDLGPPPEGYEPTPFYLETLRAEVEEGADPERLEAALAYSQQLYDAEVRAADGWVGKLLDTIDEHFGDRATVAVISDHGEGLGQTTAAGSMAAAQTRIPLTLHASGTLSPRRISDPVEAIDLVPTLLELAGIEEPAGLDGSSLVPLLRQDSRPLYLAISESAGEGIQQAIALAGYRLVLDRETDEAHLFHLAEDPLEQVDIAALEPEKLDVLRRRLDDWQAVFGGRLGDDGAEISEEDRERLEQLKNLGYVQ